MAPISERLRSALADRYTLERELGSGGMATVYLAEDPKHGRQVAIKVLRPELAAVTGAERFLREIEIAARLQHPHILTLIDSGEANGFLYYVMPYVAEESLRARLAREGELPVNVAARILREIVDALKHAHGQGLVHRDVKPDNVLLSGDHAVVTDFGVAKAVSEATGRQQITTAGMALGTPAYMAPEQAAADPNVDHRADIYAAGIVAYEMLTGRPPFTGNTPQQVLSAHVTQTPEPVTKHRATVPRELADLIMRCLEKKPADRWQSAAELLQEIDAVTTPTLGTMPVPATRASRRAPLLWGALGVAAVVSAVFLVPRSDQPTSTDPNRLAIVPFAPVVPDTGLARLGRELVVLLSTSLDGVGELRTVLGSTILAQIGESEGAYTVEEGVALARSLGAGFAVHANLLRQGENVRAEAVIVSTVDGSERRFTSTALAADKAAVTDSIGWAILRAIWEEGEPPSPRLADKIGTQSLDALSAFLEGEEAFVDGRFDDAGDAYERAFAADSTFWLAYLQHRRSRTWVFRSTPQWIVDAYSSHRDELPEPERLLLEAGSLPTIAQRLERRRQLTVMFPDYWPVVFEYADDLIHGTPIRVGTSVADARAALERTVELNPRLLPAWFHLWWATMMQRDSAGTFAVLDTLEALDGRRILHEALDFDWVGDMRLESQALFHGRWDPALFDSLTSSAARTRTNLVGFHGIFSHARSYRGAGRLQVEWNRAVAQKTTMRDVVDGYEIGAAFAWAGRGAWDSAMTAIEGVARRDVADAGLSAYRLTTLGAWLGTIDPAVAASWRARAGADARDDFRKRIDLTWLDGILAVSRGDPSALARARAALATDTGRAASFLERSLGAFGASLRGDADRATAEMLAIEREVREIGVWNRRNPVTAPVHRLFLGRSLLARGELALADTLLRWHEGFNAFSDEGWALSAALPIVYLERARLFDAWDRHAEARAFYRRFLRAYDTPDRRLRPLIEEAERALARLAGVEEAQPASP